MDGLYKICNICGRKITDKDIEKRNIPTTINNIPGHCHSKCKAQFDIDMVSSPISTENIEHKIKDLI